MGDEDRFSHLDAQGRAQMVDVGAKEPTAREAIARGFVYMQASTLQRLREQALPKGDVLAVARVAGVMAAKRCDDLIPLCHGLPLEVLELRFVLLDDQAALAIEACARCTGKTGVEMEALCAVSIAALTVYDMCKAVDKSMQVGDVHLWRKRGGRSGEFHHPDPPGPSLPSREDEQAWR